MRKIISSYKIDFVDLYKNGFPRPTTDTEGELLLMGCIQMIGATKLLQTVFLSTLRVKNKETSMDQPTVLFTFKMRATRAGTKFKDRGIKLMGH